MYPQRWPELLPGIFQAAATSPDAAQAAVQLLGAIPRETTNPNQTRNITANRLQEINGALTQSIDDILSLFENLMATCLADQTDQTAELAGDLLGTLEHYLGWAHLDTLLAKAIPQVPLLPLLP